MGRDKSKLSERLEPKKKRLHVSKGNGLSVGRVTERTHRKYKLKTMNLLIGTGSPDLDIAVVSLFFPILVHFAEIRLCKVE